MCVCVYTCDVERVCAFEHACVHGFMSVRLRASDSVCFWMKNSSKTNENNMGTAGGN